MLITLLRTWFPGHTKIFINTTLNTLYYSKRAAYLNRTKLTFEGLHHKFWRKM